MDLEIRPSGTFVENFITKDKYEDNFNTLNKLMAQNHSDMEIRINALKSNINQQETQLNNFTYELQNKHVALDKKLQDYFDYNKERYDSVLELINSLDKTLTNQKQLLDVLLYKNQSLQELTDKQNTQIENINAQLEHISYSFSLRDKFEVTIGYALLIISTFIFLFSMDIIPEWTSIIVLVVCLFVIIRTITTHKFTSIEVILSDALPEENIRRDK